jgi:hypothetical protein
MGRSETSSSASENAPDPGVGRDPIRTGRRKLSGRVYATARWLHVYMSMASFLAMLFFAITGVTLNHPEWTPGSTEVVDDFSGVLPPTWRTGDTVDWLAVSEYLRTQHDVRGALADYRLDEFEGSIAFRAPGYLADAFIDPDTGAYELTVVQAGTIGVLNELHRGTDAGAAWGWLIDVAGGLLTLIALTGLGILVFLNRFRRMGLTVMALSGLGVVWLALRIVR